MRNLRILGMCVNWKVVAGLVVVGLAILLLAPRLFLAALPLLIVAVCPLSMLLMMRTMGAMNDGNDRPGMQGAATTPQAQPDERALPAGSAREERVAKLRADLLLIQARLDTLAHEDTALGERAQEVSSAETR